MQRSRISLHTLYYSQEMHVSCGFRISRGPAGISPHPLLIDDIDFPSEHVRRGGMSRSRVAGPNNLQNDSP